MHESSELLYLWKWSVCLLYEARVWEVERNCLSSWWRTGSIFHHRSRYGDFWWDDNFWKNINSHEDHFLGLHSADTSDSSFYYEIDSFFLDKKNVYFIESDKIRRVNRLTGKANVIIHATLLTSVAFDGQYFFILMKNTKLLSMIRRRIRTQFFPISSQRILFWQTQNCSFWIVKTNTKSIPWIWRILLFENHG